MFFFNLEYPWVAGQCSEHNDAMDLFHISFNSSLLKSTVLTMGEDRLLPGPYCYSFQSQPAISICFTTSSILTSKLQPFSGSKHSAISKRLKMELIMEEFIQTKEVVEILIAQTIQPLTLFVI